MISAAITVLLKHLDTAIDPSFNTMARMSYLTYAQVSGESTWMEDLVANIEGVISIVRGDGEGTNGGVEGKKYVRNFLDKCYGCVKRSTVLDIDLVGLTLEVGPGQIHDGSCQESASGTTRS